MEPIISLDANYKWSEAIISRRIEGEAVLVPIRKRVGDLDAIYALNETAAFAWSLLDGSRNLRQVVERVTAEFAVEEAEASQDLMVLVAELSQIGALETA